MPRIFLEKIFSDYSTEDRIPKILKALVMLIIVGLRIVHGLMIEGHLE